MKKNIIILVLSLGLLSCSKNIDEGNIVGYAQGTTYSIKYWFQRVIRPSKMTYVDKNELSQLINQELLRIDDLMSNYKDNSVIENFNKIKSSNSLINLDIEIIKLLNISKKIHKLSEGCYDPTIKPLFDIWGFKDNKFNKPTKKQISNILDIIGFDKIELQENGIIKQNKDITIDLSAIGQGYAIKKISEILEKKDIKNYIVEIGGEMLVRGNKANNDNWKIAVENPIKNNKKFSKIITIKPKENPVAIMTSGTYLHYFDDNGTRFSHIINPTTGSPVSHSTVAATVLANDASVADAWSTAMLCLGADKGIEIANKNNLAVIFFKLDENNKLQETRSDKIISSKEHWELQ